MKHTLLIFLVILVNTICVTAQCDCTKTPYKPDPPCKKICFGLLLAQADTLELTLVMGLDEGLTNKIFSTKKRNDTLNLDILKAALSSKEYAELMKSLDGLNNTQLKYFSTPIKIRQDVLAEWKNMRIDRKPA